MTNLQIFIMILAVALGTMATRFTPFFLFPENKKPPQVVIYLGKVLPASMMGLLVVYCLKGVSVFKGSHGIPEFVAIIVIVVLHKWKNNVLLSIAVSTAVYMFLVQKIF